MKNTLRLFFGITSIVFCAAQPININTMNVQISSKTIFSELIEIDSRESHFWGKETQKTELIKLMKEKHAAKKAIDYVLESNGEVGYVNNIKNILGPGDFDLVTLVYPYSKNRIRLYLAQTGRLLFQINNSAWMSTQKIIPKGESSEFIKKLGCNFTISYSNPDIKRISFDQADGDYPGGIFVSYPVYKDQSEKHVGWLALTFVMDQPIGIYFTGLSEGEK